MLLSAEQYEQICSQLRTLRDNVGRSERRSRPRAGLRAQITLLPCRATASEPRKVWVRDLSPDGIGFISNEMITVGTPLLITLPRPNGDALEVLYITTRAVHLTKDQFSIGARLERVITADEAA